MQPNSDSDTNEAICPFSWTTLEGRTIIREITEQLIPQWSNGPRPSQLECWAYTLSRKPVVLIASTGWGKTAAFFVPILVLRHIQAYPRPRVPTPPQLPVALVVTPLIELGNAHAKEISSFGLRAVSLNAETLRAAAEEGRNLVKEICDCKWSVVLLSAERLISKEFDSIIRNENFRRNLVLLGIDEAHVVVPWGKTFRKAYQQIPHLIRRLPDSTSLVAVSATLSEKDELGLCSALELNIKKNDVHRMRLSCERPNVRIVIMELTHGLNGYSFPDIAWAFRHGVKAVIYCATLELCFRVAIYGWRQYPAGSRCLNNVRVWTSITSSSYNARTLDLFKNYADTSAIIATVAFGMGMNIRNIVHSVNLGLPASLSNLHQQNGRAGRDFAIEAHGWTFVESSIVDATRDRLECATSTNSKASKVTKGKARVENLEDDLRTLIVAYIQSICLYATINGILGDKNPASLRRCDDAGRQLPCNTCLPFWNNPSPQIPSAQLIPSVSLTTTIPIPPVRKAYPKHIRENAGLWLNDFAAGRWRKRSDLRAFYLPIQMYWEGTSLSEICDLLHLLDSQEMLNKKLCKWVYLTTEGDALLEYIKSLTKRFDAFIKLANENRGQKAAATRAKNKEIARQDKENMIISAASSTPLKIRLPPRPRAFGTQLGTNSATLAVKNKELASWEPPPVATAFGINLKRKSQIPEELHEDAKRVKISPSTETIRG